MYSFTPSTSILDRIVSIVLVFVTLSKWKEPFVPVSCRTRLNPDFGFFSTTLWRSPAYQTYRIRTDKSIVLFIRTICSAILWRWRSLFERWFIQLRMKFFVNNIARSDGGTRCKALWKTWKPQYLRWGDEVVENKVSGICESKYRLIMNSHTIYS